ncbi:hypothetical protein FSZ31_00395 [Sphingorhabdus soli]|uniref:FAD-dependent oxidoreductase n=1 Tax=Flavisphingopyxis soli TaxID=2601267 RepID=A0A5C6UMC5_9SPHN|nr:lycopene cyclase family protein [Sphingorhabdus soli]TXC73261.1 hypothetical protein FSZ31_00395 [Sphingorhabdus soli]
MTIGSRSEYGESPAQHDVAIVGGGLLGSLLALAFARHRPDIRLIVFERCERFGGDMLEPVVLEEVPDSCRSLIDGAIVKIWPACYVILPDSCQSFGDSVALVDPRQLHLEMIENVAGDCLASCVVEAIDGARIVTDRGAYRAQHIIDTRGRARFDRFQFERRTQYRDFRLDHGLEAPVLADFSQSRGDRTLLQMFPVDGQRIIVEHWRRDERTPLPPVSIPTIGNGAGVAESLSHHPANPGYFPCLLLFALRTADAIASLPVPDPAAVAAIFLRERAMLADRFGALFAVAETGTASPPPTSRNQH